VVLAKNLSERT